MSEAEFRDDTHFKTIKGATAQLLKPAANPRQGKSRCRKHSATYWECGVHNLGQGLPFVLIPELILACQDTQGIQAAVEPLRILFALT